MPRIRFVEIEHFRCIRRLAWAPRPGLNALIGPGDSGKSTVLDALDLCLGLRRSLQVTDADFHRLDVTRPIRIAVTVGELPDSLLDLEGYGLFIRGFDASAEAVVDEPGVDVEPVLTMQFRVDSSLEPTWTLFSERAAAQDLQRGLGWAQRARLAPIRLSQGAGYHLAWRQGSLLSRLAPESADAAGALAAATRAARAAFTEESDLGDLAAAEALDRVTETARGLGLGLDGGVRLMLDVDAMALSRGSISLHGGDGVPLQCLGTGSLRMLVAAMQREVAGTAPVLLLDEAEHGLEPHRIRRLLDTLGAKEESPPGQVFLTTHSPVVVRELDADALHLVRRRPPTSGTAREAGEGGGGGEHLCRSLAGAGAAQGVIRSHPEALLGRAVVVCEGGTEVGLLRGLDQHAHRSGGPVLAATGVIYVDADGDGSVAPAARAFQSFGLATAVLRDNDVTRARPDENAFVVDGGAVFVWPSDQATEDVLFAALPEAAVRELLRHAVERLGEPTVREQIKQASQGAVTLADCEGAITQTVRTALGKAAQRKPPWFKTVGAMQKAAREIVGPALETSAPELRAPLDALRAWAERLTMSRRAAPDGAGAAPPATRTLAPRDVGAYVAGA